MAVRRRLNIVPVRWSVGVGVGFESVLLKLPPAVVLFGSPSRQDGGKYTISAHRACTQRNWLASTCAASVLCVRTQRATYDAVTLYVAAPVSRPIPRLYLGSYRGCAWACIAEARVHAFSWHASSSAVGGVWPLQKKSEWSRGLRG